MHNSIQHGAYSTVNQFYPPIPLDGFQVGCFGRYSNPGPASNDEPANVHVEEEQEPRQSSENEVEDPTTHPIDQLEADKSRVIYHKPYNWN